MRGQFNTENLVEVAEVIGTNSTVLLSKKKEKIENGSHYYREIQGIRTLCWNRASVPHS